MIEAWKTEYQKLNEAIISKIDFIKSLEKKIDLSKPDSRNIEIRKRIDQETKFVNDLIAFLTHTENLISDLVTSNKHLKFQNTINFYRAEILESEFPEKFEKKILNDIGSGS
jgi:hypothetical protein